MANIVDILKIQPTVVSRDLQGKFLLVYGMPKVGKTSFAAKMPQNLMCAFEVGTNALSGVKAVNIDKWTTFKSIIRQLRNPAAKEMYKTVTIDTVGIAYSLCEEYICTQQGVNSIGEIPYGGGYGMIEREFSNCLRQITQEGYGMIIIAHSAERVEKNAQGNEVTIVAPDIPKRGYKVINQLVDIIGYIGIKTNDKGEVERCLVTRQTPTIMAGSRFKYLPKVIPFGYKELTEAITEAVERAAAEDGEVVVTHSTTEPVGESRSFQEMKEDAKKLWEELMVNPENLTKMSKIIQSIFGRPVKLSEVPESQKDLFELVLTELEQLK